MSYLETRITREEFISTRGAKQTQDSAINGLNMFDYFCKNEHNKNGDEVILDIQKAINHDNNSDRMFRLCNSFVQWLQQDHTEIKTRHNRYTTHIKKHNPSTIKIILNYLRQYLEEFGQIEFSERRFKRMVKLPRKVHEEPEPITKEDIRAFVEVAQPKRRALYMLLKDSAMRIGEACQLRKKDIDLTTNPVTITVQAINTKTKHGRTTFVTRETKPYLQRVLDKINENDLVFGSNEDVRKSVKNEEFTFRVLRERVGLTQKYESSGMHKKNLHGFRAYCATALTERFSEEMAHGFLGHKGYLQQYIRNKGKLAEKYLQAENHLMVYQTVEVIENSISSEMIEERVREEMKKQFAQLYELETRREQLLAR